MRARFARYFAKLPVTFAGFGLVACSARPSPPAVEPPTEAPAPATALVDVPDAPPASGELTQATAPSASTALEPRPKAAPNWAVTGNDPATGAMTLRCENAFPPDDHSGKCMCQGYELNVCVNGTRSLTIDRKQCAFICKPTTQVANKIAVRCPDGNAPIASAAGCECSGRKTLDPCAGGIQSATVTAGECVVTCKKNQ